MKELGLLLLVILHTPLGLANRSESLIELNKKYKIIAKKIINNKKNDINDHLEAAQIVSLFLTKIGVTNEVLRSKNIKSGTFNDYYFLKVLKVPQKHPLEPLLIKSKEIGTNLYFCTGLIGKKIAGSYRHKENGVLLKIDSHSTNIDLMWLKNIDYQFEATAVHEFQHAIQNNAARKGIILEKEPLLMLFRHGEEKYQKIMYEKYKRVYDVNHSNGEVMARIKAYVVLKKALKRYLKALKNKSIAKKTCIFELNWIIKLIKENYEGIKLFLYVEREMINRVLNKGIETLADMPVSEKYFGNVEILISDFGVKFNTPSFLKKKYIKKRSYIEFHRSQARAFLKTFSTSQAGLYPELNVKNIELLMQDTLKKLTWVERVNNLIYAQATKVSKFLKKSLNK